jgi:hypothetical protein
MGHYLWGMLWLLAGFLLLVCGTSEWKPWQNPRDSEKKKKTILLATVIGLGGLFTTLGWNQFSTQAQEQSDERFRQALQETNREFGTNLQKINMDFRQDLDQRDQKVKAAQEERDRQLRKAKKDATILGVAREWKLNEINRSRSPFSDYENGGREKLNANLGVLTKFEDFQSKTACTSDVFDWTADNDRALVICVANYARVIESVNQVFDIVNAGRSSLLQTEPYTRGLSESVFGEQGVYPAFLTNHNKLGELLKKDYKWVMDDIDKVTSANKPDKSPRRKPDVGPLR